MELPKNIIQVGESDKTCKVYVEDYVVSYLKQLNRIAGDKNIAVGLYGNRREENGISYLFLYGAGKLNFLQRESRHLSQAVQQEAEKQRQRYFMDYTFLGYRILNGEMIEGFQIYEQDVCRYIAGYAQFYEKNDSMLAYMLEEREETEPEQVDREKYDMVRKRQEERRLQTEMEKENGRNSRNRKQFHAAQIEQEKKQGNRLEQGKTELRKRKLSAAAVFVVLCAAGVMTLKDNEKVGGMQEAAKQVMKELSQQQLPDALEVSNLPEGVGTIVAEDKLTEAIRKENESAEAAEIATVAETAEATVETSPEPAAEAEAESVVSAQEVLPETAQEPVQETVTPTVESSEATAEPAAESSEATAEPASESASGATPEPTAEPATVEPVAYVVQKGDTLIGICLAQYGNNRRVQEVCRWNGIENPDDIKVGQTILLP